MILIYVAAGLLVSITAYAVATAVAGRMAGLRIASVTVGAGPALASAGIAGTRLQFAPLPISSRVQFEDLPGQNLAGLPLLVNLLVQVAGPAAMAVMAVLLLGNEALDVIARVWKGAFGLFGPDAAASMHAAIEAIGNAGPLRTIGLITAANAAVQLLPLPPLPGGMVLMRAVFGNDLQGRAAQWAFKAGLLGCLILAAMAAAA